MTRMNKPWPVDSEDRLNSLCWWGQGFPLKRDRSVSCTGSFGHLGVKSALSGNSDTGNFQGLCLRGQSKHKVGTGYLC